MVFLVDIIQNKLSPILLKISQFSYSAQTTLIKPKMTKAIQSIPHRRIFFCLFGYVLLSERVVVGDPRAQTVQVMCGRQLEHNSTIFVPNFVATMENISEQMRSSGFGVAVSGSGPDINYGLAQCYGDLSLLDCVLCYAEARTILPQVLSLQFGSHFPRWMLHAI
uniref:Gnk2-homologous domain-containing protein n=1 Tax=Salix viminalis TaxID=40686 RepID=A0A6N2N374_SALVM